MRDADEPTRKVTPPRPPPETGVAFFLPLTSERAIEQYIQRLGHTAPGVRRIAALDLLRSPVTPEATPLVGDALVAAINREQDLATRLALVRALGHLGGDRHRPALAQLRALPGTPPDLAHAAILAHDSIEVRHRASRAQKSDVPESAPRVRMMPHMPAPAAQPRPSMVMPAKPEPVSPRHLLGLQGMSGAELRRRLAIAWRLQASAERNPTGLLDIARGRIVANVFFEDSTRTRTSFAIAARRIGAEVVELVGSASSVNKGETLIDTARNVAAMGVDAIVTRTRQSGGAANIAGALDAFGHNCAVVNGGDGRHEHPTQGLLDTLTLAEAHRRADTFDLSGLTVAIVGDVVSSRVARSNIAALTTLGAQVLCVGPAHMAPGSIESMASGVRVLNDMDQAVELADAVMMLRIQFERHDAGPPSGSEGPKKNAPIASVREYRAGYALTAERAQRMKRGAVVMHPGPINRNIELDAEVADGARSVVMRQVTLGVAVRMATLAESSGARLDGIL